MLRACVRQALATPTPNHSEVELRLGRVDGDRAFSAALDAWHFFALVDAVVRARDTFDVVTPLAYTTTTRYAADPTLRRVDERFERKCEVRVDDVSLRARQCFFDVRVAVADERGVDAADVPMSATLFVAQRRHRERRSARSSTLAPGWRLDMSVVTANDGRVSHEFELEYDARSCDVDAAADGALRVLEWLACALGRTHAERSRYMHDARERYEFELAASSS